MKTSLPEDALSISKHKAQENAQKHIWIKKTEHQQAPAESAEASPSSRPGRDGLHSLRPHLRPLPLTHTCSAVEASVCGASSFKNIKYKTLPYSISNHSIYKFYLFKKKCKRYSNSTQFKFFFSSLNFPREEFQKQETLRSSAAAIPKGSWGAQQSVSVEFFCPESLSRGHSNVEDSSERWSLETRIRNVQAGPRQYSTRPSPCWAVKSSLSKGTHPTFHAAIFWCPSELQWLMISVSCLKRLRNNSLSLSGSEHTRMSF